MDIPSYIEIKFLIKTEIYIQNFIFIIVSCLCIVYIIMIMVMNKNVTASTYELWSFLHSQTVTTRRLYNITYLLIEVDPSYKPLERNT